jgi:transcriptional regulator
MLHGTLAMLILSVLQHGPLHGYAIARRIHESSGRRLQIEEGSLYPALRRLRITHYIRSRWGTSNTNRKVRVYQLTDEGRSQLQTEVTHYNRQIRGIQEVLETT